MKKRKTISVKLAIGITIFSNALTLEMIAIYNFGNVYNIYTIIPILILFGSIILMSTTEITEDL